MVISKSSNFIVKLVKPDVTLTLSLLIIFLMPGLCYVTLSQDSLAKGLFLASLLVVVVNYRQIIKLRVSIPRVVVGIFVISLLYMSALYKYFMYEEPKSLFSLPVLLLIFLSAMIFSVKLKEIDFESLEQSFFIVISILLILGWLKIFTPIRWGAYSSLPKSVFPFSEESFYALSVGMLSVGYAVTGYPKKVLIIVVNMFLLSVAFPSLTLLLSSILTLFASSMRLRPKYFKLLVLFLPILIALSSTLIMKNDYYSSRLTFENSKNLSTLVFLQGWFLAYINTIQTNGVGLGFQMLGMPGTHLTPYTDLIEIITVGSNFNLTDGGLLAAKVIAEFGIIGLFISLIYFAFVIKIIFTTNQMLDEIHSTGNKLLLKRCLLNGLLIGFVVEYFFRGYGYFSPDLYLFVATIIVLIKTCERPGLVRQ